jgi:predicted enzyme related to lactoylglutathione lyase
MLQGLRTTIYSVGDQLEPAKAWFAQLLGYPAYFDQPFYVGFNVGGYELGLIPDGEGATTYWGVADIQAAWGQLIQQGAQASEHPKEVGGGIWVATVNDPFGNRIGIIQNPHFELNAS